jgi:hypothetical protein
MQDRRPAERRAGQTPGHNMPVQSGGGCRRTAARQPDRKKVGTRGPTANTQARQGTARCCLQDPARKPASGAAAQPPRSRLQAACCVPLAGSAAALAALQVLLQHRQALSLLAVVGDYGAGALDDLRRAGQRVGEV